MLFISMRVRRILLWIKYCRVDDSHRTTQFCYLLWHWIYLADDNYAKTQFLAKMPNCVWFLFLHWIWWKSTSFSFFLIDGQFRRQSDTLSLLERMDTLETSWTTSHFYRFHPFNYFNTSRFRSKFAQRIFAQTSDSVRNNERGEVF